MSIDYSKFNPTHAILYQGEKILVFPIGDGEYATEKDWENGALIGSFATDEDNDNLPTSEVWILDPNEEIASYKEAESEIKLIKICSVCLGDRVTKNGKTASRFQRWKCHDCDRTVSDQGSGRPTIGESPMSAAERKRKQRSKED